MNGVLIESDHMTGSHEVRGSIPLSSIKKINQLILPSIL